jgi:hypothetical protein
MCERFDTLNVKLLEEGTVFGRPDAKPASAMQKAGCSGTLGGI